MAYDASTSIYDYAANVINHSWGVPIQIILRTIMTLFIEITC